MDYIEKKGEQKFTYLTDKDCQQFNKSYRLICQLYYESSLSKNYVEHLIHLTEIVPQIIQTKTQANALMILSQMEILKAKAKNQDILRGKIQKAIEHLRIPQREKLNPRLVVQLLRENQLFTIGCTIAIRLFKEINQSSQINKLIFQSIGNNLLVNPTLSVELLHLLCSNEENIQLCVREGIVKSLFLNYIPQVLKEKLPLYKCIKLLKTIGSCEKSILRERQKVLSTVIFTYDQYIPSIQDICQKCYDPQYCGQIDQQKFIENIDQLYLWSHSQSFAREILTHKSLEIVLEKLKAKPIAPDVQAKLLAIASNFCRLSMNQINISPSEEKYCSICDDFKKQLLKMIPKNQESLLNYLKMCNNLVGLDQNCIQLIDWPKLDNLVSASSNSKVIQLQKMLKQSISRKVEVGTLNNSMKSMFSLQKNADLLRERVGRIPKNNAQLEETRNLLKEEVKAGASELDQDNAYSMKQKAIQSLHCSIAKRNKLNINPLINEWHFGSVDLLSKFLQVVELNLMMNQQAMDQIDLNKILEMITWLEQNYNGQIVDWGGVMEILANLFQPQEWIKHIKSFPKRCFWLLQIDELTQKNQNTLLSTIKQVATTSHSKKVSMIIGFLGKTLSRSVKVRLLSTHKQMFQKIKEQLSFKKNYTIHLMMLSYFIKSWHFEESEKDYISSNKEFKTFIAPLVDIVITNYKALPQEHYFLQSCFPYKIPPHSLTKNIGKLVQSNGQLAAYLFENQAKSKANLSKEHFNFISTLSPSILLQHLKFLGEHPEFINPEELQKLLQKITNSKNSFWNLYPHYVTILSLLIQLIDCSQKPRLTDNIISVIDQIQKNEEIQKDDREGLLYDVCETLENLQEKGTYIEIQRIKKNVTKIIEQEVRQQIIIILNNYKIKEQPPKPIPKKQSIPIPMRNGPMQKKKEFKLAEMDKKQKNNVQSKRQQINGQSQLRKQANLQSYVDHSIANQIQIPKQANAESIQQQFQSVKIQSVQNNLFGALEMLRRIVQKQEPTSKFNQIYPILSNSTPNELQKQLMGSLLAKFYPMEVQERALTLLLDKQRTSLARQAFQDLVRTHKHAFKLVRRWRFQSRQALDIAMARITEGYLDDACVVATYNLKKAAQIQHFNIKKYQNKLMEVLCKVVSEDQIVHFLTLVGTVSKLPQIKEAFLNFGMHVKVMPLNTLFPMSVRVNSSLCYALSTLSFEEAKACSEIIEQKQPLSIIYECMRGESTNKTIVEPGVCLIANLSYPSAQIKQILRQRKTISLLLLLFENNLANPESSIYKQLLRSMGSLSMVKLCTEELIQGHFCSLAVRMAENLDFFVYYDEKKARLMKLLISLIFNLANHKTKLDIIHTEKVTLLIITMLETTEKNTQLLSGCIDSVDALCQSPEIELYMVAQKRLLYILMDVLKLQDQAAILLKAGRLVSNLSIHNQCIPEILKANILSVIGNVVVPNLYMGCIPEDQSKRMEGYVVKILSRVFQSKPELQLILKSGFLDCLVRTIELIEVDDSILQILFFYSSHLPNFLNKRAFSCLIKTLTKKVGSQLLLGKCIVSFKNLLTFSYNRQDQETVIEDVPQMYENILKSQYIVDGLFLMVYHLLRSHSLRKTLSKKSDKIITKIQLLGKQDIYIDISRTILFLIYNPITPLWEGGLCQHQQQEEEFYRILRSGFRCKLYRADGSHKSAKLDLDDEYNIRLFKYPDGEIKSKYVLNINHVRDLQIDFKDKDELWTHTVFALSKSLLQSHVPNKKLCVTLVGSSRWGQVKLINFQFASEEDKWFFYQCISHLIYLFKT